MNLPPEEIKRRKARALRYKKGTLDSISFEAIQSELETIIEVCDSIRYTFESEGMEVITDALDGDEDEAFEFKMMFSDLDAKAEQFIEALTEIGGNHGTELFDDCMVGMLGKTYKMTGYDDYEDDYFTLDHYEMELATNESAKRLMKLTKKDMLSQIGECLNICLKFLDLRQQFDYLSATLDILKGENQSVLDQISKIDTLYTQANAVNFNKNEQCVKEFNQVIASLPDRFWIE